MSKWEVRCLNADEAEVRAVGESRGIEGYGVVFNSWSEDLGGFREIIKPEAVTDVFERSDVFALLNHSFEKGVLARNNRGKGTLSLQVNDRGVKYSFTAPKYGLGDEVLEGVERGDIRASSFAFTVARGGEHIEKNKDDGVWERTITQFDKIYDVSCVYTPAYTDTTVAKRNLEEVKAITEPRNNTKPIVVDEVTTEPVVEFQRSVIDDLEIEFNTYIIEQNLNEL
jgi:HK97 family phage prohead protease